MLVSNSQEMQKFEKSEKWIVLPFHPANHSMTPQILWHHNGSGREMYMYITS